MRRPLLPSRPGLLPALLTPVLTAFAAVVLLCGCSLKDATGALDTFNVRFSEGSPAVDGQNVTYSGSALDNPSLDKFRFKMVFHVKADNSGNDTKASFGSSSLKPILNFRVSSKSGVPISTAIEPFSVEANSIASLDFPIEIPIASLDRDMVRKIIAGDPIPYFLGGTLKFDLLDAGKSKGAGTSELDLTSGSIQTRPSNSVTFLLSSLL
ncbi:MAG: hypothetical protein JWP91_826 [Fibrobacteres bacterium]|nr:hypothetical protein [Fibrobacterota bacterium]